MKVFAILQSMKQYLAGLLLRSISDDLETSVALTRADRVRELESLAARDRDNGNTQAAALLESSASRLTAADQMDEGFAFVDALTKRSGYTPMLDHSSSGDVISTLPEPTRKRKGRPRKNSVDSGPTETNDSDS